MIWFSILGVAALHAAAAATPTCSGPRVLTVSIGLILASAFPAILVYAQELVPGRVGMVAGLFFGFAFGMGGLGAAVLGELADHTSIEFVYRVCAYLPLIGLLTAFLPHRDPRRPVPRGDKRPTPGRRTGTSGPPRTFSAIAFAASGCMMPMHDPGRET